MVLSLLLALLITVAALVFAFQNAEPARVSFLVWQLQSSLGLVLVVSFAAGLVTGVLLVLPARIRAGLAAASEKKELAKLNRSLTECESNLEEAQTTIRSLTAPESPRTPGSVHPG